MHEARWEHFTHGADIGVRGIAPSVGAVFEQTALAMTAVICEPSSVTPREAVQVACAAPDYEYLLVDWLNAIVYEMATRRMLFSRFEVTIAGDKLTGTLWGEPVDVARHQPAVEVKGATYTELKVAQNAQGQWVAQCVVDV
jgi:tRNA nucleotidyltransferase (CCA-adding enzyme)